MIFDKYKSLDYIVLWEMYNNTGLKCVDKVSQIYGIVTLRDIYFSTSLKKTELFRNRLQDADR